MEIIKKYLGYIIAAGLLLMLLHTCSNAAVNNIAGQVSILDRQYQTKAKELNKDKVISAKLVDSLHKANNEKDMQIGGLQELNNDLDKKILDLSKKNISQVAKVKNYTKQEDVKFISAYYDAPNSVFSTDKGITLQDSLPTKVVETIVEKEFLDDKLKLTESKLSNTEKELNLTNDKVINKDKEIKSLVDLSDKKDSVIAASSDLNVTYKKENKRLRTNRTIERIAVGAAAVITGVLLIK